VSSRLDCYEVDCCINGPHSVLVKQPMPSPTDRILPLTRFPYGTSPLPNTNCWTLEARPVALLRPQDEYFLFNYGIVQLRHVETLIEDFRSWEVFYGVEPETEENKVVIVVRRSWAVVPEGRPEPSKFRKIIANFPFCI